VLQAAIRKELERGVPLEDIQIYTASGVYRWSPVARRWESDQYLRRQSLCN
jgi:hypothetical protein